MDPIQNLILGGISSSSANDGVSVSGNKVKLGHVAEGSGLSDFTANRYNYLAGFKWGIGGTAGNNFAQFDGATGQFSLGTATPNAAALCEISSTAKGVLLPRMTTAQKNAIATPPTSLLLFDTTLGVYQYYTGSAWSNIGTTYTGNNGVSLSSSTFQLGHAAAGSGLSDFTANRYNYLAGFKWGIGGTAGNNFAQFDGATGQFSLGTATPNEAALCEISSTAKGVLLPRMTTAQKNAISTPPTSLLLFDSTLGVYQYYTGSAWSNIGTTYTGNNGVSLSSSTFQLGHVAAGSGASDFTANRFMYMAGFYLQIGGTANNNLFKFNTNGNYDIAGKLTIGNDATYTTQGTSAIINQTTNGGIAIVPNGTGAFTLRVPDGGNAGGLARGTYAVDFTHASTNSGCATGSYSVIIGGHTNSATATHAIVLGGTSNNATGSNSICGGNQFTVSGSNSYGLGSEGSVSGNNAGGIGRQIVLSGGSSYMMAANSTVTSTYSFLNGTGGKCVTSAQNVFARGLGVNGTSPSSNSGTSQIINGIAGIDTKIAASLAPQASATYMLFNPLNTLGGTEVPFYVPSTSNMMFVVEADIQIRVVGINGTATGVTVGDIKQVKIRQTGKVIGGTLTFLSALTTTLDYEDASLNTMTFVFINSTNRVNIQCTNATFAGGGTLDLLAMATYKVSESSAV